MDNKLLDLYTDYLISQNGLASATGLSEVLEGEVSHDKITRFLNLGSNGSKELWDEVKPTVRKYENISGVLMIDDTIEEKPYSQENEIIAWHYSHAKGIHVKGVNLLSCMVRYEELSLPVCYEVIHKDLKYFCEEENKWRRRASITKNEHFRNQLRQCAKNEILYKYILTDNWFGSKENLEMIHYELKKYFIIGIKANRTAALSYSEKLSGHFHKVSELNLREGQLAKIYLKGIEFPMLLMKKVFTNENGSEGVLYLITNDLELQYDPMYEIYKKRWRIEEYHKSIKQNTNLAKSPTKTVRSQSNHIFASIVSFVKLEKMRTASALNHFALKYKILLKANQTAFLELQKFKKLYAFA